MKKREDEEIKGNPIKKNSVNDKDTKLKAFLYDMKKEFENSENFLDNTYNNLNQIDIVFGKQSIKDENFNKGADFNDSLSQISKTLSTKNNDISNIKEQAKKNSNKKPFKLNPNNTQINNNTNNIKKNILQKKSNNKSNLTNISNILNLEEIPETSKANLNLMNLQNIIIKEEDTLSPIIHNKNISEFLSNNKLINTDLKSSKKTREANNNINNNNEEELFTVAAGNQNENNKNDFNDNNKYAGFFVDQEGQDNLETPKAKKQIKKRTVLNEAEAEEEINSKNSNVKFNLRNQVNQNKINKTNNNNINNYKKKDIENNKENNNLNNTNTSFIINDSNFNSNAKNNLSIEQQQEAKNYLKIKNASDDKPALQAQRIKESEYENETSKNLIILNSERIKQQNDPRKAEKVVFTLSKPNESSNAHFAQSRAFEFFDSNDLESTKGKIPFRNPEHQSANNINDNNFYNFSNNENDQVNKNINFKFNNLDLVPIENENKIDNSKRFYSKTLTNFQNSNEFYAEENNNYNFNLNKAISNDNNRNNDEKMIVLKTESDELNQSNDLKEKINELNLSMKLRKSGSLNFNEENKKRLLGDKLLRKSNTKLASGTISSNKNSSKNIISLNISNTKNKKPNSKNKDLNRNILNNVFGINTTNIIENKQNNNNNNDLSNSIINNNFNNNNSKTLNFSKSLNFSKLNNNNNNNQNNTNNQTNSKTQNQNNLNNTNQITQNNSNFLTTTNQQNYTNLNNTLNNLNKTTNTKNLNTQSKRNSANNLPSTQNNQIFPASTYTYHNSSYLPKNCGADGAAENESLIKSKLENSKIFETAEILALISNAKSLEKVLSDETPLKKIEEFEKKLQANAKVIESLQGHSADLLHDKMEMEIKIKEVKGLINQFNDGFVKIDKFLDKRKLKNFNKEYNKTVFDENEYLNLTTKNSKSFLFGFDGRKTALAQQFSSFKKKNEFLSKDGEDRDNSAEKLLNRTFHPKKNKRFETSCSGKKNTNDNNKNNNINDKKYADFVYGEKRNKIVLGDDNGKGLEQKKVNRKEPNRLKENVEFGEKLAIEESSPEKQTIKAAVDSKGIGNNKNNNNRNKNLEIKSVSRISENKNNKNKINRIEDDSMLKKPEGIKENLNSAQEKRPIPEKVRSLSSAGSDFGFNHDNNNDTSYNTKKLVFSKEDEEELENLEKEIQKIDFDLKMSKENNDYKNKIVKNKNINNNNNNNQLNDKLIKEQNVENNIKKNYKKIEINNLLSKKNPLGRERNKTLISEKNESEIQSNEKIENEFQNNERTMRSNMRSTKYDSDFNKGNSNITSKTQIDFTNITKIQKILHDLETIKNRTLNLNNSNLNNSNINNEHNNENNINNTNKSNKKINQNTKINKKTKYSNFNSKYNSANGSYEDSANNSENSKTELNSNNKTYHKSNKTLIDLDNSKLINKFFKEEKIAEAIEIWKRLDYKCFDGVSLERSFEMIAQITKIKDKDLEKLSRKVSKFDVVQKESNQKDSEIIELVGEVESLKYKIIEMESKIGNYKNLEKKFDEKLKENSFLFKENVKLRTLLDQERYFNSYRNQPNFMMK